MPLCHVRQFLAKNLHSNIKRLVVAYSGGVDSHVLLDVVVQLQNVHQRPIKIIHIHHGLSSYANDWAAHVQQIAKKYHLDCRIKYVQVNQQQASLEEAARQARYQAINQELINGDVLLLAHHQQDQAETFLLRLMRGAGVKGLGGMSEIAPIPFNEMGVLAWRPLLSINKQYILAYAKQHHLTWIEDDSNSNEALNRNYLRHQIVPLLQQRWPQAIERVSAASQRLQEAEQLLQDLANIDYQHIQAPKNALDILKLAQLSEARRHNVLRYWLQKQGLNLPDYQQLNKLWLEVGLAKADAQPVYYWPNVEVRRYRQQLFAMLPLSDFDKREVTWHNKQQKIQLATGEWLEPQQVLTLIKEAYWQQGQVSIRYRQGGEKIQPVKRQHHHDLKKLLQAEGVPTWQRARIPLIYINQQLAIVWGYWVSADFAQKI